MWERKFTSTRYAVCLGYVDLVDLMGGRCTSEFVTAFCFSKNIIRRNDSRSQDVDENVTLKWIFVKCGNVV
jgi:hypothetical protein